MDRELAGKTALVTGASRGLGSHIAERLAAAGAMVAVNYANDRAAADATVARIEAMGGAAFAVQGKLSGEAEGVIDASALRRFGQPQEIADIVYALASPLGRWVTAQCIDASGGFRL